MVCRLHIGAFIAFYSHPTLPPWLAFFSFVSGILGHSKIRQKLENGPFMSTLNSSLLHWNVFLLQLHRLRFGQPRCTGYGKRTPLLSLSGRWFTAFACLLLVYPISQSSHNARKGLTHISPSHCAAFTPTFRDFFSLCVEHQGYSACRQCWKTLVYSLHMPWSASLQSLVLGFLALEYIFFFFTAGSKFSISKHLASPSARYTPDSSPYVIASNAIPDSYMDFIRWHGGVFQTANFATSLFFHCLYISKPLRLRSSVSGY